LVEKGALPSDYVFCMARKKYGLITQTQHTANVGSNKDSATNTKVCETIIKEKDAHIHNIETELNLIKQSKAWRTAECFRRLFYIKLLGKFPLLKKAALTVKKEGFRQFLVKTKRYLTTNKNAAILGLIERDYDKWIKKNELTDDMIEEIKKEITRFEYKPKLSIIMPVYNVDQIWLEKAIDSVINQLRGEERIKIKYLEENQGISGASNEVLHLATGEFIGLLDNDDELTIDALYENVKFLNKNPEADLIYSDEDKIDTRGNRTEPFFKPDYSPDFLLTKNYICHFSLFRRSIINNIGGFRRGYEGAQDYDLILRFIEKTKPERIFHIPKILYHWRKIPGSTARIGDAKSYVFASAKKALSDYLKRNNIQGEVVDGNCSSYRVMREVKNNYKVSIIIPFKDQSEVLKRCVSSIVEKTKYRKYEIVLVNNQSKEEETFEYLDKIRDNSSFRILDYDNSFNFSAINNYAVRQVDSEYIVLLNNDTEVISPDWIENMLEFAQRKDVGAVGALLYYPNDTIQHGGVILGIKGVAGHSHKHMKRDSHGYFGRTKIVHNLSAVTAACLMTKKSIFNEVDGFDVNLTHAFNDVDYCLKIREKGYLIVYTPYAELYHHESLSRGYEDTPEKQARFRKEIELFQEKWKDVFAKGDPYYSPNLTLEKEDFSIRI
jgi:GT2 family glycosyltransferase